MFKPVSVRGCRVAFLAAFFLLPVSNYASDEASMSQNAEVIAVPAPGPVTIDGRDDDWDLSAGVWSYNDPQVADRYGMWTHLMWDEEGLYYLARMTDSHPKQNAAQGVDFQHSWQGDAVQLRTIFDDGTDVERQMHMTLYYSTPDEQPYLIVHHGGFGDQNTGPRRPDLVEKLGEVMTEHGGRIAVTPWPDGGGYNIEAFMPWSYLRESGEPLAPGDEVVFGWEALWAPPVDDTAQLTPGTIHRLADGVNSPKANRTFMFRARRDWGKAIIADTGNLAITDAQRELRQQRLNAFLNLETFGSVPIAYELTEDREVTIAINDVDGNRVRSLIGQYPRSKGKNVDYWDGLNDEGEPVAPGKYTAVILDFDPIEVEFVTSVYNAGTPAWPTTAGRKSWGSDHGSPSAISTIGDQVVAGFMMPEAGSGVLQFDLEKGIDWSVRVGTSALIADEEWVYIFNYDEVARAFVLTRLARENGRLTPFETESGELIPRREFEFVEGEDTRDGRRPLAFLRMAAFGSIALIGDSILINNSKGHIFRFNKKTAELLDKQPSPGAAAITSRNGVGYALLQNGALHELHEDLELGEKITTFQGLKQPNRFGVSQESDRFAVTDLERNQVVVFDREGGRIGTIGSEQSGLTARPGGEFVRSDIYQPSDADFDSKGRVWVAEGARGVNRVSVFSQQGEWLDEFWGGPYYGAFMSLIFPHDFTRFIGRGIEFRIDQEPDIYNRKTEEVPHIFHPYLLHAQGRVHSYTDKTGKVHEFAFNAPGTNSGAPLLVYRRDESGQFIPAAGLFPARTEQNIDRLRSAASLDYLDPTEEPYAWIDRNGDGRVDADEIIQGVDFRTVYWGNGHVRDDLSLYTNNGRIYALKEVSETGVPIYDFENPEVLPEAVGATWTRGTGGTPVIDSAGNQSNGIDFITADGKRGSYPSPFGRWDAPAARPGLLVAPFRTNGVVEDVPAVGSITALQGDRGQWFLLSLDGLFISSLFQDLKGVTTPSETFIGGESFGGHIWRDQSDGPTAGRVFVQTGHRDYRIMEVKNLDSLKRQEVRLNVTAAQIQEGQQIAASRSAALEEDEVLTLVKTDSLPASAPDPGIAKDEPLIDRVPFTLVQEENNPARWFKVSLMTDGEKLAVIYQVADDSPWKNAEADFTHAFIGGDAVDLKLDSPDHGPIRILGAPLNGEPTLVYWRQNADEPQNPQTYVVSNAPENARSFEVVRLLEEGHLDAKTGDGSYTALMTVPLASLGISGELPDNLSGIVGVIFSDATGSDRMTRLYWHDKATTMVNDVPTESAVNPEQFGEIQLQRSVDGTDP